MHKGVMEPRCLHHGGAQVTEVLKAEQEFGLQAGTTRDNLTLLCRGVL